MNHADPNIKLIIPETPVVDFRMCVKYICQHTGCSSAQLAKAMGVSTGSIYAIIKRNVHPRFEFGQKLLAAYAANVGPDLPYVGHIVEEIEPPKPTLEQILRKALK